LSPPLQHHDNVWSVAFSPDGKTILTGSGNPTLNSTQGEARLWEARPWKAPPKRPFGQDLSQAEAVTIVALSQDGRTILTGSRSGTVRLWDAATGQELRQFEGHQGAVSALA